ncbi:MAG: glutamate 5-kinase [Ottowia sp.]|nr:glutamate 5-kinase [Ottowia sp.]
MSTEPTPSDVLRSARRIIVKVGSTLVTNEGRGLDAAAVGEWCRQLALLEAGSGSQRREVVMVSSGAIAEGMKRLGWAKRPSVVSELQAAAAVGQMGLAQMYETQLAAHGLRSAQVLLTHADLADRERYLNARATLLTLLEHRVLPVINENDSVITDEIRVGDNDTLGALVANLIEADLLVILTDQKGLFDADPRTNPAAKLITEAHAGNPALEEMAGGAGSAIGKGGMLTKVLAARRAAGSGASTVIAWGREPDVLLRLAAGERIGTLLVAPQHKTQARKQWIADHLQLSGALTVDDGAATRLRRSGASLLPVGVIGVTGNFVRGDAIAIRDAAGVEIARGLVNYSSNEARLLLRQPSSKIAELLGYAAEPEMVHRDNLALTH